MSTEVTKVGIIACSGEAIPEGTLSRIACQVHHVTGLAVEVC